MITGSKLKIKIKQYGSLIKLTFVQLIFERFFFIRYAVEPPASDNPKCQV